MKRKKSRRARGTGGCRFDARRGCWVGRVPVGRYPSGAVKYREVSAPTQAECLRLMNGVGPLPPSATVAEFAARWLAAHGGRPATLAAYRGTLRTHVLPAWGHLRLCDVTPSRVEALAADMAARGRKPNTVALALGCARAMFASALRDGLIPRNPVSVARKPRRGKKRIDPFSPGELRRIIDAAAGSADARALPVALMAATGCRIGEAVALDATDFDAGQGVVSITKTCSFNGGTGPPKSANGVRTIRVPARALPALVAARGGRARGPLFVHRGRRADDRDIRGAWYALLADLGLARRNPHQLRHTVATHMIAAGVPLADVAAYLGDSVATVVVTYLHPTGADAAGAMERILGGA